MLIIIPNWKRFGGTRQNGLDFDVDDGRSSCCMSVFRMQSLRKIPATFSPTECSPSRFSYYPVPLVSHRAVVFLKFTEYVYVWYRARDSAVHELYFKNGCKSWVHHLKRGGWRCANGRLDLILHLRFGESNPLNSSSQVPAVLLCRW